MPSYKVTQKINEFLIAMQKKQYDPTSDGEILLAVCVPEKENKLHW